MGHVYCDAGHRRFSVMKRRDVTVAQRQSAIRNNAPRSRSLLEEDPTVAETKNSATKPTPEEKLAAAEAEVDALVAKGLSLIHI